MIYHFNEVPIFYEVTGEGPHMLLLHGFLESSTIWSTIVPELSGDNTMVTLDLPGHGKSGCIAETHSIELMAEVVYSLLKYLKIKSVSFVGHSMGGYVALAFAEKYEHKIFNKISKFSFVQEQGIASSSTSGLTGSSENSGNFSTTPGWEFMLVLLSLLVLVPIRLRRE